MKSVQLLETAQTHALQIGEPTATLPLNTRFTHGVQTDSGLSWVEHHPRSLYPQQE